MKWIVLIVCLLLIGIGLFVYFNYSQQRKLDLITTFDQCVEAGYPVLESYPPQCRLPNGANFTQEIGNELEYVDEILVENPRPNQAVSSPLKVTGKARGPWYFEANFSGELFDDKNQSLGVVILQAEGDWMIEEFVPFSGVLEFRTTSAQGTLVLKNANPSGLPEYEKTLVIPVSFK